MRLLVVSNRLPVTIERKNGGLRFQESVGGLVSGLSAYLDSLRGSSFTRLEYVWVGWPGIAVKKSEREEVRNRVYADFHAYPVFIQKDTMDTFYLGFCNRTIWPLFHYFPSFVNYDEEHWKCYREVNERFRDAVLEIVRPDDIIWIHDYHLMLLSALLRKEMPDISIGFFLHIPFPSFELFRLLPVDWRRGILEGIIGADLIGFHTHDYTQYFLRCVLRILGYEHNMGNMLVLGRFVRADTFPMGIDYRRYAQAAESPEVSAEQDRLRKGLEGYRVILSVDRLDYTKGILNRLRAFETFLKRYPDARGKVVMVLLVVPSRIGVIDYQRMKSQIDEYVGKINGTYGNISWTPIRYLYRYESFRPLVALYAVSDICLVTPLRDGMNLVAKEYIASRIGRPGVLVLSEMAGAAKELGEAVLVNPNDINEIAEALKQAFEMPNDEQMRRNRIMQRRLERYDVVRWADEFIQRLTEVSTERRAHHARLLGDTPREGLLYDFRSARRRLIFVDYDGTIVPFAGRPENALPDDEIMSILAALAEDTRNETVIISGRDRATIDGWFGRLDVGLAAEHGAWIREQGEDWKMVGATGVPNVFNYTRWGTPQRVAPTWKPHLLPLLEIYADRLPGAFVEEKEYSLAWHYRMCDPEQSSVRAKELLDDLVQYTANINVQVLRGNKVIEVRNAGVGKGIAARHFLSRGEFEVIVAIGDDLTDEDLFKMLPESAYTIKVGISQSGARFTVPDYRHVRNLLRDMSS